MFKKIFNGLSDIFYSYKIKEDIPIEVMETLKNKFPDIPPEKVEKIVDTFLELIKNNFGQPVSSQQEEIQSFVAEIIKKHFKSLNLKLDSDIENVAFNLVYNKSDPEEKGKLSQYPVSPQDMKLVKDNIIGIDVIYDNISSQWERTTRIFVKSVERSMEYSQSVKLEWDSLPSEVRKVVLETREQKQRFILYNPTEGKLNVG